MDSKFLNNIRKISIAIKIMKFNPSAALTILDNEPDIAYEFYKNNVYDIFQKAYGDDLFPCDIDKKSILIKINDRDDAIFHLGNLLPKNKQAIFSAAIYSNASFYISDNNSTNYKEISKRIIYEIIDIYNFNSFYSYNNLEKIPDEFFSIDIFFRRKQVAENFIKEFGGVVTGSFALSIYNYENNLPRKFNSNDIDIVLTDKEMYDYYIWKYPIIQGHEKLSFGRNEYFVSCEYTMYQGTKINLILASEGRKKSFFNCGSFLIGKNFFTAISEKINEKFKDKNLIEKESIVNQACEKFYNFLQMRCEKGEKLKKEEIEKLANDIYENNCILRGYQDEQKNVLVYIIKEDAIKYLLEKISNSSEKELFNYLFYNSNYLGKNIYRDDLFSSHNLEKKGFFDLIKKNYLFKEWFENDFNSFLKSSERKKPNKKFDIEIFQKYLSDFDFAFCKLVWHPEYNFLLTNNEHTFISANFGISPVRKDQLDLKRSKKYTSRGFKIFVV